MTDTEKLYAKLLQVCPTERRAKAAISFFSFISANGLRAAKQHFSPRTFSHHQSYLKQAGLADADISTGEIVTLRRKVLECQSVNSWSDLMAA